MITKCLIVLSTFVFGYNQFIESCIDFGASATRQPYIYTSAGEGSTIIHNSEIISLIASAISAVGFISLYIFVPITYTGVAIAIVSILIGGTVLEYAAKLAAGEKNVDVAEIFTRHIGKSLGAGLYVYLSMTAPAALIRLSLLFSAVILICNITGIGRIDDPLSMIYSGLSIDLLSSKKGILYSLFGGYTFTQFEYLMAVLTITIIAQCIYILEGRINPVGSLLIILSSGILLALGMTYGIAYPILTVILFQFICWFWLFYFGY